MDGETEPTEKQKQSGRDRVRGGLTTCYVVGEMLQGRC